MCAKPADILPWHGGTKQPSLRAMQIRGDGGYFRNESSTFSLVFDHGSLQAQTMPYQLIGMVVAFVGFHGLQVGHVAEDEVLVGDAVAAEDVASHAGAV